MSLCGVVSPQTQIRNHPGCGHATCLFLALDLRVTLAHHVTQACVGDTCKRYVAAAAALDRRLQPLVRGHTRELEGCRTMTDAGDAHVKILGRSNGCWGPLGGNCCAQFAQLGRDPKLRRDIPKGRVERVVARAANPGILPTGLSRPIYSEECIHPSAQSGSLVFARTNKKARHMTNLSTAAPTFSMYATPAGWGLGWRGAEQGDGRTA